MVNAELPHAKDMPLAYSLWKPRVLAHKIDPAKVAHPYVMIYERKTYAYNIMMLQHCINEIPRLLDCLITE